MTFWGLVFWAPSAARWSAFSFPVILACPLTHSKDVCLALFLSLFTIGFRRLAWEIFIKSLSVWDLMFSHSAFMAQAESVLMCSLALLGVSISTEWMARSSAMLLDWMMFFPMGALMLSGLLVLNHTPKPALVFLSPFRLHEPLV